MRLPPEVLNGLETWVRSLAREEVEALLPMLAPAPREWLKYEEAGERLGRSPDAVRMLVRRGRLESKRLGRSVFVSARSLDALGSPIMSPDRSMAPARLTPPEARPQEVQLP